MRLSLVVTILAMGALAILLAIEASRVYRDLAETQQREALTEQLRFIVHDLRGAFEGKARELATPLTRDAAFLAAVRAHRRDTVTRSLERHARVLTATSSATRLEKVYVYDAAQQLVGAFADGIEARAARHDGSPTHFVRSSYDKNGRGSAFAGASRAAALPPCQSLQLQFARRNPAEADKPLSGICIAERNPYYAVVLPLGVRGDTGSLHLVMDLAPNLAAAEYALGMPLALAFGDGTRVYRSVRWPAAVDENTLVVSYSLLAHADSKAYMNLSLARDVRAFNARLAETRRLILFIAAIVIALAIAIALAVLQKTAIDPLRALTAQLRKLRQDERYLGQQVEVRGNTEVIELGEGFNEMTTRLQSLYQNLESLAFTDPLTKLPNRALFRQRLEEALAGARRDHRPFALFLMDLDHFKEINDTLGHRVGDLLLAQVAERLRQRLRQADMVARLGGDEFAVLLPGLDTRHAAMAAKLLLQALHDPFNVEEQNLSVGASVGIALYPDHGVDLHTLMQRADVAMYAAKRVNDGFAFYDAKLDTHAPSRFTLLGELRQALERHEFRLFYQPKVNLASGEVTGVEALVRWKHPRDGLVLPDVFIPLMEQTGMLRALTPWMLDEALAQSHALTQQGHALTVALNLSARDLLAPHLVETFAEQLEAHGVAASQIEIEITESTLMSERERAQDALARLAEMGIKIAIDDFGVGYSSLAYLRNLPVDTIKIDRSFVIGMGYQEDDAAIVHTSVDLAHNLGLDVVAEGVESDDVLRRLHDLGCDAGQGNFISRPLTADELQVWLRQSSWAQNKKSPARGLGRAARR